MSQKTLRGFMAAFLKLIGTAKVPAPEPYLQIYADFSPSRNPAGRISIGDHLLLYAAGGRKCVFATARVTSPVVPSGDSQYPHRLNIEYEIRLSPAEGVPLYKVDVGRDLQARIRASYFTLFQPEYDQAEAMLLEKHADL